MVRFILLLVSVLLMSVMPALAAPLKTYVAEFSVVGVQQERDALKSTLQGLLTSRLDPKQVVLVEKPEKADLQMFGSYAMFGKMFSIDLLVKNPASGSITKVFEQGGSQDELLPAFGRLAKKIDSLLAGMQLPAASAQPAAVAMKADAVPVSQTAVVTAPVPVPVTLPVVAAVSAPTAEPAAAPEKSGGYLVRSDAPRRNAPGNWTSEPIPGIFRSIALGRTLPSGEREIFIAGDNSIQYLHKSAELVKVSELAIPVPAKVVAIDTADLDKDGTPEIYVSIVDRKTVSSRVYKPTGKGLELIASDLPWLFRGAGAGLKERRILAQAMNNSGEYQNGVAELLKNGNRFSAGKQLNLPKRGNIHNFAGFTAPDGKRKLVVLDEDGYLVIYSAEGDELGKSSDKFGGSETFIDFETIAKLRNKVDSYNRKFIEQRITPLADGTLIIPKNTDSMLSVGNNRTYTKHSIFGLQWSGAVLMEAWHTRQTPTYLADYAFDAEAGEFVVLEVVQRAGLFSAGKSVVSINKVK